MLACVFLVLFLGNTWTTLQVLKAKFSGVVASMSLRNKYATTNGDAKAEHPKNS